MTNVDIIDDYRSSFTFPSLEWTDLVKNEADLFNDKWESLDNPLYEFDSEENDDFDSYTITDIIDEVEITLIDFQPYFVDDKNQEAYSFQYNELEEEISLKKYRTDEDISIKNAGISLGKYCIAEAIKYIKNILGLR